MAGGIIDGCPFRNCKIYSRLEKNLLGLTSPRKLHTCDNEFWNTNDTTALPIFVGGNDVFSLSVY